jgi:hypothetical protein
MKTATMKFESAPTTSANNPTSQPISTLRPRLQFALAIAMLWLAASAASAQTVLYSFNGKGSFYQLQGALIADSAGNFYSTASSGGLGTGGVFELSPPAVQGGQWTETTLYSFTGKSDGGFLRLGS